MKNIELRNKIDNLKQRAHGCHEQISFDEIEDLLDELKTEIEGLEILKATIISQIFNKDANC